MRLILLLAALGASDIKSNSLDKGLIVRMPLTSGYTQSTTVASDRTPYRNHGTATGTPAPTFGAAGVALDGIDQVVTIPDSDELTPGDSAGTDGPFTISAWVTRTAAGAFEAIVAKRSGSTAATMEWQFAFTSDDKVSCQFFQNAGTDRILAATAVDSEIPFAGTLTHYACVYTGNETAAGITVYRNGVDATDQRVTSGTYTGIVNRSDDVTVGLVAGSTYFTGTIAGVKIARYAWTQTDLGAELARGVAGNDVKVSLHDGLVLDVPLRTSYARSTTLASDKTPNRDDMTIVDTTLTADGIVGNGSSRYALLSKAGFRSGDSAGAVSVWYKTGTAGTNRTIWASGDEATANHAIELRHAVGNNFVIQNIIGGTANTLNTGTNVYTGTTVWRHLVLTSTGTAYTLYINNASIPLTNLGGGNTGNWFADVSNRDNFTFGVLKRSTEALHFSGSLACGRVYSRNLDSTDVNTLYQSQRGGSAIIAPSCSGRDILANN